MDKQRMEALAREALGDSKRNDCEFVGADRGAGGAWRVELMDVMMKREIFVVEVTPSAGATEEEIKESVRRGIAEHFSAEGN